MNKALLASQRHNWMTPLELFETLHDQLGFDLDPCADTDNLGIKYFTKEQDGLKQDWKENCCFVNPPYGSEQKLWIEKALSEKKAVSVFLIPARVDTVLWQDTILKKASAICFIKGRLRFIDPITRKKSNPSPFPSALILFNAGIFDLIKFRKACKKLGTLI
jgi:site-specific DNA-methyltransferase (adenine-specific)